MAHEGAVRALRNIHTALRPGGFLLDIQPEPKHPWVEVRKGIQTTRIGQLDETFRIGMVLSARAAVQRAIDAGWFVRECDITFIYTYHFASVEAWQRHMAEHWSSALIPPDMAECARELLSSEGSELCIPREIHATRLRGL